MERTVLTDKHKLFVQFMLTNGCVTKENGLKFFFEINPEENSMAHLKMLIIEVNREIANHSFKIAPMTCEVTNEKYFIWINTKNDEISRHQSGFSPVETEYFHALLQEIITSQDHKLLYPHAVNIASTLTTTMTRENGEKSLLKWLTNGYLVKKKEYIYLGPRTILEFTTYLKRNTQNCNCSLCTELVFVGGTCNSCNQTFHSYCLQKFFQNQETCPNCKNVWENDANSSFDESHSRSH